jgi:hypothetical protein
MATTQQRYRIVIGVLVIVTFMVSLCSQYDSPIFRPLAVSSTKVRPFPRPYLRSSLTISNDQPLEPTAFDSQPVTLRLLVLTYKRFESMERLVWSLQRADYGAKGQYRIDLDICIDRPKGDGPWHEPTVQAAESIAWTHGVKTVRKQATHAGIYGQWIDTWMPTATTSERALFLEDDLEVSPHYFT